MTPRALLEPARLAGGAVLRLQTDDRLVELTRAGNDRAFDALVERYRRPLLRYSRRLLPYGGAEDALRQALSQAYAAIPRDDAELELRPWLFRVTHNAAVSTLRRRG